MMVLYTGELLPADAVRLPLPNRGLFFNDGFFETLVWANGQVRYARHHMARMQRAAAALSLELPAAVASVEALTATVNQLVAASRPSSTGHRIRLQLWRSGGGLYTPTTTTPEWLMTQQPFQEVNTAVQQCAFAQSVHTQPSAVAFCKGPNALLYVLGAQERQQRQLDEVILLSTKGHVAETVAAAIAWTKGNTLYTPAETTGCVAGTRLAHLREVAELAGIKWQTGEFGPEEVREAEAVFTANIAGIRPIRQIEEVTFLSEHHPVLQQLRALEGWYFSA